ncbi:MAG: DUF433 domain-containing protein [Acidobacteria bacterium]|jgi:uncharacterized protein (DUF433 family)|nr:DUF433 domain-containing protein [Acidobacteriota bacterium]
MTAVIESYIEIDANSVAWVADTRVKVIEIALDKLAHGSSPEELHFQYPHLSMAQIHAALAYYYDHREELDDEILRRLREVNELAARQADSPLRQKLRGLRLENER